ncbi:hypothetical protein BJ508DRAFT_21698 [Ascobolus immersus RN42]|uniref:Uncharacterized protein n=1 Tax=Ascobolus immersus RN42 TaxID=1160509 RepID=A0A3N4HNG1_ASCIM|nr:hypothetical protein BJ508DRAFT_21698 [Ascobolus immersus RN42]
MRVGWTLYPVWYLVGGFYRGLAGGVISFLFCAFLLWDRWVVERMDGWWGCLEKRFCTLIKK